MAQFPCDHDGARYRGAQSTAYPAVVNGSKSIRGRRRLCREHYQLLQDIMAGAEVVSGTKVYPTDCCSPGCDEAADWAIFLTGYDDQGQREDRYCRACLEHAMWLGSRLFNTPLSPTDAL